MYQGPLSIPTKTDDELKALVAKTQPLVRRDGKLVMTKFDDLRNVSFVWSKDLTDSPGDLVEVGRETTLHTYGHYGLFKPSIAEVLCQMPEGLNADFFEVRGPVDVNDLNNELVALNKGFHVATTIFYKRK